MAQAFTVVTLADEDGDEFPIRLPGVYVSNRAADVAAAMQLLAEEATSHPRGAVSVVSVEYVGGDGS